MARIVVKCFPAPGFDGVFRAGRKWPASGLEVETIAAEGDVDEKGEVLHVGTKTLKALEADGRFSFGIAGTIEEVEAVRAENAALKERVAELEAENAALKAAADSGEGKSGKKK